MKEQLMKIQQFSGPTTLLTKDWKRIFFGGIALFAGMTSIIYYEQTRHGTSRCVDMPTCEPWFPTFRTFIVGASCAAVAFQTLNIFIEVNNSYSKNSFSAYMIVLEIMLISLASELLNFFGVLEKGCSDPFKVWSTQIQWCEWQVTVPLMFYMCITLDCEKKMLSSEERVVLMCSWFSIFIMYVVNLGASIQAASFGVFLSTIAMAWSIGCTVFRSMQAYSVQKILGPSTPEGYIKASIASKRLVCALYILFVFPMFPVVYFCRVFGIVNHSVGLAEIALLNFASKSMYGLLLMHGHLECLDPIHSHFLAEKKANDARRTFLRHIFHEVRSPLNTMVMGLHVLMQSDALIGKKSELEALQMIRNSSQSISESLNEVLNMQKVEEGMLILHLEQFAVRDIIPDIIEVHKDLLTSKNIQVVAKVMADVPEVVDGDVRRLQQALANLLGNAIKFSAEGASIEIVVSAQQPDDSDSKLVPIKFSVLDKGPGIACQDQPNLFVPYIQNCAGELKAARGAGVGLALCKEIIHLHGGFVGYNNREDGSIGSEFFFVVPFTVRKHASTNSVNQVITYYPTDNSDTNAECTGRETRSASDISSESHSDDSKSSSKNPNSTKLVPPASGGVKLNVLIVDDVPSNRKMLAKLLQKRGINCEMAADGVEALDVILEKKHCFDFLVMDKMMPNMNGVECTKRLRNSGFDRFIMGLTGNPVKNVVSEFESAGADIVLPKPFKLDQLDALLHYINEKRRQTSCPDDSDCDISVRHQYLEEALEKVPISADDL